MIDNQLQPIFSKSNSIPKALSVPLDKASMITSGGSVRSSRKLIAITEKRQTDRSDRYSRQCPFDKLLILRALRPEFPDTLFFTTDFDEAFTVKSELPFTRNLIVASSFGPYLSNWLQGDIPYFRDTYQTSAFLATQLALGSFHDENDPDKNKDNYKPNYPSKNFYGQLAATARLIDPVSDWTLVRNAHAL